MLILSRKDGETLAIGDEVVVTALKVEHDRISLGIDAPPEVSVHRGEVWLQINERES